MSVNHGTVMLLFCGGNVFIVVTVCLFSLSKRIKDRALVFLHLITEFCPGVNKSP